MTSKLDVFSKKSWESVENDSFFERWFWVTFILIRNENNQRKKCWTENLRDLLFEQGRNFYELNSFKRIGFSDINELSIDKIHLQKSHVSESVWWNSLQRNGSTTYFNNRNNHSK